MNTKISTIEGLSNAITAGVNHAIKYAAETTTSGNYVLGFAEFEGHISEDDFIRFFDMIEYEVLTRKEVLALDADYEAHELSVYLGLDYCPNYEWCEGDEAVFGSYDEWLNRQTKGVSQPLSMSRMAQLANTAIENAVELYPCPSGILKSTLEMTDDELVQLDIIKKEDETVDTSKMTEYIKVNFPLTEQEYKNGNGEGMWVLVDPETKKAHDEDATGSGYIGVLDNDSFYYPGLDHGTVIPFEMRGEKRPVADYHGFLAKLDGISQEEKAALIRKIAEGVK